MFDSGLLPSPITRSSGFVGVPLVVAAFVNRHVYEHTLDSELCLTFVQLGIVGT